MTDEEETRWDVDIGIEEAYRELRGNASKNRVRPPQKSSDSFDLSALSKERDYRVAVAKIADDLKRVCSGIRRSDKLKSRKPPVTRTEAKSKVRSEKISAEDLVDRLALFGGCCAYCSEPLGKNKQVDHVVPISKLGADTLENIVFVCQSCNSSKGNRDFLDWYRTKSFWNQERESKVLSVTGKLNALKV